MADLPISVIITTKNEETRIARCLQALSAFDDVIVVDSQSADKTKALAKDCGARVIDFAWNGCYPKKRQWCLDHVETRYPWIFFVDADEIITPEVIGELMALSATQSFDRYAGFYVRGQYIFQNKTLRYGLKNNKLALLHRERIAFPVLDDLGFPGMGEMEGHYQPQRLAAYQKALLGQISAPLLHEAFTCQKSWDSRHERYARWEVAMDRARAWPQEEGGYRRILKRVFKALPFRGWIAFVHSYVLKRGALDGRAGFAFAMSRKRYYDLIAQMARDCFLTANEHE